MTADFVGQQAPTEPVVQSHKVGRMLMFNRAGAAVAALALAGLASSPAAAERASTLETVVQSQADSGAEADALPAGPVSDLTNWVLASGDNHGLPFVLIDKVGAHVFAFDADGKFVSAAPALLGIARGDDSAPGVGKRKLSAIKVDDRTTPAGRFAAKLGRDGAGHNVLWIDYANAISLHAVVTSNKKEHRLQRLNSASVDDNRISFGCINVPGKFYAKVVRPLFMKSSGIVYILPETKPLNEVFLAYQPTSLTAAR